MASSSGGLVVNDPQKFVDSLLNDLRTLSTEARRKHESVKDAAESALVKVRNISTTSDPKILQSNLRNACSEILHPLVLGCSTKNPKLVQISLQSIQRALQFGVINESSSPIIVRELWNLTEAECEELKVLQTITLFVSSDLLVTGSSLSKCIVLAIKLNFSKDPSVINAASAAVRQLFNCTFERVVQEDGITGLPILQFPIPADVDYSNIQSEDLHTKMGACAADSLLLLKDLISLIRRQATAWLIGVKRFTITLALELLETIVKNYPSVFFHHVEHAVILRDLVCPELLFNLTGKKSTGSPTDKHYEKPPFPVLMRCLRIGLTMVKNYHEIIEYHSETFIEFVVHLLASRQAEWQAAAALEVIHKIVGQPELLRWLCSTFHLRPNGPKLVEMIVRGVTNFNCRALRKAVDDEPMEVADQNQPGFLCGETFIAIHENVAAKRWILLDWLEKHEASNVPPGYCISLAYACLIDVTHSIYAVVEEVNSPTKEPVEDEKEIEEHKKVSLELFQCAANSLLHGLVQLLVASVEDSVTESLLNCLSTVVILACKTGIAEIKDASFRGLCRYALPVGYFDRFITHNVPSTTNGTQVHAAGDVLFLKDHIHTVDNIEMVGAKLDQVIAMGTVCPTYVAPNTAQNESFNLTAKNMKVARILVASTDTNGQYLTSTWDMILATLQHFTWVIGIKPLPNGGFRTVGDPSGSESSGLPNVNSVPTSTVLTTAVVGELPSFNQMLNKLMEHSSTYDDVSLHHVIASLCELSSDQMKVAQKSSKDISFFAISKLLQTSIVNLFRLDVFWRPITAHLVEVCGHSHPQLREWGSLALTQLVMSAMRQYIDSHATDVKRQILIMTPLSQLNEVSFLDVKQRQLDCVMNILEVASNALCDEVWEILVGIILQIAQDERSTERLIEYAHSAVSQIGKEFLDVLPFQCLKKYLHTVQMFGQQTKSINIALSAIGLLWHVSDQIRIRCQHHGDSNIQQIWLVLFQCLGELCVDYRPAVRKSACDTLLQTVACHSDDLSPTSWHVMLTDILFTLLDKVRIQTKNASTNRIDDSTSGNQKFLVHHSRDTPAKQWAETTVRTLFGVVRIFNAQRHVLKQQDDFFDNWNRMIQYIEYTAMVDNPEISLAALKDFHEFHFGKVEDKPNEKERTSSRKSKKVQLNPTSDQNHETHESTPDPQASGNDYESANTVSAYFRMIDIAPPLPDLFWIASWKSWYKIGKTLTTSKLYGNGDTYRFIPGPFHWTTYLQIFPSLFARVKSVIDADDFKYNELLSIFKKIVSAPRSSDQAPFSLTTANPELSPAHEAVLECIRILAREMTNKNSNHREALPDLFHLLLDFSGFSLRAPQTDFIIVKTKEIASPMPALPLFPFADICLKFVVEYYSKVATMREIIDGEVLVAIIRGLSDPLVLRYHCPTTAVWMNAASAFLSVCRTGLPIARQNLAKFKTVWFPFITILDKFLFCKNQGSKQLNAEERKRFEFVDCQMIELLRIEILPYASILPWEFMQRVIDILNKASIITLDPNDTFASDLCEQRTDLCKVSFDALLSLSQTQIPGEFFEMTMSNGIDENKHQSLGAHAISSLLLRCTQVINAYARDAQSNGRIPLLSQRVYEVISVLRAISALIEGLNGQPKAVIDSFIEHLIELYPNVVQMVACCKNNADVQLAVMTALNSYRTIMTLNFSAHKQTT